MQVRLIHDAPCHVGAGALVVPFFNVARSRAPQRRPTPRWAAHRRSTRRQRIQAAASGSTSLFTPRTRRIAACLPFARGRAKFEPFFFARYAGIAVRYWDGATSKSSRSCCPQARGRETVGASFVAEGALTGTFETTVYQGSPESASPRPSSPCWPGTSTPRRSSAASRAASYRRAVNFARRLA